MEKWKNILFAWGLGWKEKVSQLRESLFGNFKTSHTPDPRLKSTAHVS